MDIAEGIECLCRVWEARNEFKHRDTSCLSKPISTKYHKALRKYTEIEQRSRTKYNPPDQTGDWLLNHSTAISFKGYIDSICLLGEEDSNSYKSGIARDIKEYQTSNTASKARRLPAVPMTSHSQVNQAKGDRMQNTSNSSGSISCVLKKERKFQNENSTSE